MNTLTITKISENEYDVLFQEKHLGRFLRSDDGYLYYTDDLNGGLCAAWTLIEIGEALNDLNKEWDDHINKYFKK